MNPTTPETPAPSNHKTQQNKPQEKKLQQDSRRKPVDYGAYQRRGL